MQSSASLGHAVKKAGGQVILNSTLFPPNDPYFSSIGLVFVDLAFKFSNLLKSNQL
jgi:hypothetical protein